MRKVSRVHTKDYGTAEPIETKDTLNIVFHLDDGRAIRVWFDGGEDGIRVVCQDARLAIKPVTSNVVCIHLEEHIEEEEER